MFSNFLNWILLTRNSESQNPMYLEGFWLGKVTVDEEKWYSDYGILSLVPCYISVFSTLRTFSLRSTQIYLPLVSSRNQKIPFSWAEGRESITKCWHSLSLTAAAVANLSLSSLTVPLTPEEKCRSFIELPPESEQGENFGWQNRPTHAGAKWVGSNSVSTAKLIFLG